jgi:RND superfamily putative drug exporter
MGLGGLLIPLVSVLAALTLLPVMLASLGPRLDWPHRRGGQTGRFWTWWARLVLRRRLPAVALAVALLCALLCANAGLVLGLPRADTLASSGSAFQGLRMLERAGIGPGVLLPYEVLLPRTEAADATRRLAGLPGVLGTVAPASASWQRTGTALIAVLPRADAGTSAGHATLGRVRDAIHTIPRARDGGQAVAADDLTSAIFANFPLLVLLVAALTYLLLVRAFRSLLLPLKAIVLNVLSVGAAWGVVVLVWQEGHGSQAIWGIPATDAITGWIPLMVFAFLFGLSMDYEVFILARMREEYDHTGDTNLAVMAGIGRTGRLVTSAALILVLAFISLASGPETEVKEAAIGLAAGILLDATVIRMLLVPALVSLFGRWNWWLPALPARVLGVRPSLPSREGRPRTA